MDILSDAVSLAMKAVKSAAPSQAPDVSVEGVRKTATGTRPVRGLLTSITASNGFADPLGELSTASQVGLITLIVPANGDGGWFDATPPQDGDILTFDDGRRYSVISVTSTRGLYYKLGARQC